MIWLGDRLSSPVVPSQDVLYHLVVALYLVYFLLDCDRLLFPALPSQDVLYHVVVYISLTPWWLDSVIDCSSLPSPPRTCCTTWWRCSSTSRPSCWRRPPQQLTAAPTSSCCPTALRRSCASPTPGATCSLCWTSGNTVLTWPPRWGLLAPPQQIPLSMPRWVWDKEACVTVCSGQRQREGEGEIFRERDRQREWERDRQRECDGETVCACVCLWKKMKTCIFP